MENAPTALLSIEPPFPASPSSVDLSPLEFVFALIAVVTIPALVYVFFFAVKCPPNPFRSRRYGSNSSEIDGHSNVDGVADVVKVEKEGSHASKGVVGSECPVCLMVFAEGEEVKQLNVCKHSFHVPCIDLWLNSHSNCPVCRASVSVKQGLGWHFLTLVWLMRKQKQKQKKSLSLMLDSIINLFPFSLDSLRYQISLLGGFAIWDDVIFSLDSVG